MKSELHYLNHPMRLRIIWVGVYIIIAACFVFGMYVAANRMRTHILPVGQIQLSVPYSKYLVGEAISFSIKNNFNSPVYVLNNCPGEPLAVYHLENGIWIRIHDKASISECPDEQRQVSVPANGVVNGTFASWHNLFNKPGKYRVVAFVEYYNALPYQEFEVDEAPPVSNATQTQSTPTAQAPLVTVPSSTTLPSTGIAPTTTSTTTKQSYTKSVSGAGSISVQYDTTTIYVVSITPATGCTYEGGQSGRQVQVTFKCSATETQIQLNIVHGQIVTNVESGG